MFDNQALVSNLKSLEETLHTALIRNQERFETAKEEQENR
jgi:hypothetical protein